MAQLPDEILSEIAATLDGCRVVPDKARDGSMVFWLVADAPAFGEVKGEEFHGAGGNGRIIQGHRILAVIEPTRGWPVFVDHYHTDEDEQSGSATRWAHVGPTHDPNISAYDPAERLTEAERAKRLDAHERLKKSTPIDTPEKLKSLILSLIEGTHWAAYDKIGHSKLLLGVASRHRQRAAAAKTPRFKATPFAPANPAMVTK